MPQDEAPVSGQTAALVAVDGLSYHYDHPYSYRLSERLIKKAAAGCRVVVPFGRGDKRRQGIIIGFETPTEPEKLKPLFAVMDDKPLIAPELIELALFIKEQTFCTLYEALRLMLPAGANLQIERRYALSPDIPPETLALLTGDEKRLCETLSRAKKPVGEEKLLHTLGLDGGSKVLQGLEERGLLISNDSFERGDNEATVRLIRLALPDDDIRATMSGTGLTRKQKSVLGLLLDTGTATLKEVNYFTGVTAAVVKALEKKGLVEQFEQPVTRNPYRGTPQGTEKPAELSEEQQACFESLLVWYRQPQGSASLLFGVTGSGKTQVFMRLIDVARADGKSVIVLVPEISLTPQAVSRFYSRFGDKVAVLHSGMSAGERTDEWQRIRRGEAPIVVGTRSAIFAPVSNLGLVIIDEEQEHTYKSESSPRYHARDVARFRCAKSCAMLLLASATPSVETFFAANSGRYHLAKLNNRYGSAQLPEVDIIDMKPELLSGNDGPISGPLREQLETVISQGHQAILLLNRRGFNTFVSCPQCGHVATCPNCSIALTYHSANGRLMCHYCGYSGEAQAACPECGGSHIKYAGAGTQKAEQLLHELLPQANILRMDADTTSARFSHEGILKKFEEEGYDILIGTQMVAKGLDFPNVTLVGVLSADQALYMDDFRAGERAFSLITQVVGRSGRGQYGGRAVIQTQTPDNEIIRLAAMQDYEAFYESEIALRKLLLYPPFCDICEIGFTGMIEKEVKAAAAEFHARLAEAVEKSSGIPIRVMGPSPASVLRVSNRYRYKIILKCKNDKKFREMISGLLKTAGTARTARDVTLFVDMNPQSVV